MNFDRPLYGFRFVEIRHGDTLQVIAARELGDAGRWHEMIQINSLVPPYVTDDEARVKPGVLLSGSLILVPAPVPVSTSTSDPDQVFERDIRLMNGELATENGDFAVAAGRENLRQALKHRVETARGELMYHISYGSNVRRLIGAVNGPTASLLASQYARAAVRADPRIKRIMRATAEVVGDVINVTVEAEPVAGRPVQIEGSP